MSLYLIAVMYLTILWVYGQSHMQVLFANKSKFSKLDFTATAYKSKVPPTCAAIWTTSWWCHTNTDIPIWVHQSPHIYGRMGTPWWNKGLPL